MTTNKRNGAEERAIDRMLKKVRSDSTWQGLTFEQCQTLEEWLFEKNLGYEKAVERLKQEFGLETSRSSVGRFFKARARLRRAAELMDAQVAADQLQVVPAKTEMMRDAAVKLLATRAMTLGMEKPEDVEGLMSVTKLLLDSEENEIRLRRVKLEERYYDLEANTACAEELKKVRSYLRAVSQNKYLEEKEKVGLVVKLLYGRDKVNAQGLEELQPGTTNSHSDDEKTLEDTI